MRLVLTVFLMLSGILLASCNGFGSQYMTGISNKHDGSLIANNTDQPANNKNCNQWCHNGWCSTHCEDVVTQ